MKHTRNILLRYLAAECGDMAYIVPFAVGMALIIYATA